MLQKTAIQSLSDLLAANERLKSTAETHYCFLKNALNIPSDVMRFSIKTNKQLKSPGSCFDKDKHFMRRMQWIEKCSFKKMNKQVSNSATHAEKPLPVS